MNENRSANWIYHLAFGFALLALFGFMYSFKREEARAAPKAPPKSWGTLRNLMVGETLLSARNLVRGADSVRDIERPGRLGQHVVQAQWEKGDHILTLVFLKGHLASANETQKVRNSQGRVRQRDWQALSRDQPQLETCRL